MSRIKIKSLYVLIWLLGLKCYAQVTTKIPPIDPNSSQCISEKNPAFQFVNEAHCYKPRTFTEIQNKKKMERAPTKIPSCSELMLMLHKMNQDSATLELDEFDEKYVAPLKNDNVSVFDRDHPLFKKNSQILKNSLLTSSDLAMINTLANETSAELKKKITDDIKKVGLNETKQLLKKSFGKFANAIPLNGETPEELLVGFTKENIKNSILKHLVSMPIDGAFDLPSAVEFFKQSTTKGWVKESYQILTTPGATTSLELIKSTLRTLRFKMTPGLAFSVVTFTYPFLVGAEDFQWLEGKDESYSLIHLPDLFSAFATNTNFSHKGYSCEDLYTKICNYYYSFACDTSSSKTSRVQYSFLLNYAKLRSHGPFIRETNRLVEKEKYRMPQDNTAVRLQNYPIPTKKFKAQGSKK